MRTAIALVALTLLATACEKDEAPAPTPAAPAPTVYQMKVAVLTTDSLFLTCGFNNEPEFFSQWVSGDTLLNFNGTAGRTITVFGDLVQAFAGVKIFRNNEEVRACSANAGGAVVCEYQIPG